MTKNNQPQFKRTSVGEIPKDWKIDKLCNHADIVMGQSPKSKFYNNSGEGFYFMQGVRTFGEKYPIFDTWTTKPTKIVPANSILISVRAPVGDLNITPCKMCIGRGIAGINANNKNNNFLYFLLKAHKDKIIGKQTGTVYGSISKDDLMNFELLFPSDKTQQKISNVLGSLDDMIELLQKQNQTLESLGQTIFKKWFIDSKEKNNWKKEKLSNVANFLNGLAMQKYPVKNSEYLPVIKIKELKEGITENTDKADVNIPEKYIVNNGDVLFSWSGSLELRIWNQGRGALNQHLFKVTSEKFPKWFYYYWIKYYLEEFRHIAKSKVTTMGHIQRKHLDSSEVIIPDNDSMDLLNKILNPIIEKIINDQNQIQSLSQIRDLLLPKLMSGKVRVR